MQPPDSLRDRVLAGFGEARCGRGRCESRGRGFECPSITALLSSTHLKKTSPLDGRARLRLNPLGYQVV